MKKCKNCKQLFKARKNQIFCNNSCKCKYHRVLNKKTDGVSCKVDKILHRNRSILYEILGSTSKQKMIKKGMLDSKKFNYSYMTHYHVNSKGKTVHYYYDISMIIFSTMKVLVKRNEMK